MKYLILTMALISAFFVSAIEPDLTDLKSPKVDADGFCDFWLGNLSDATLSECGDHVISKVKARPPYPDDVTLFIENRSTSADFLVFQVDYDDGSGPSNGARYTSNLHNPAYSCPPYDAPSHFISVGEGSSMMCAKEKETESLS